jgi:hypothetical protein
MLLTKKNLLQRDKYKAAQPKRSGNLHERMKLLRKLAEDRHDGTDDDFWNALDDLETEVSMYDPAEPPFGERVEPKHSH